MELELLDHNRTRWNRSLLNGFWVLLAVSAAVEALYLTVSDVPFPVFVKLYIIRPTLLQLAVLLVAEIGLRFVRTGRDYLIIVTSALLAGILVFIHVSIDYLMLALFLPVMVAIFYFDKRKLQFALINTLAAVNILYFFRLKETITIVGLGTLTVMFLSFTLIGWAIIRRGRELVSNLQTSFESNQELLVKTIEMDKLAKTDALTGMYNHMTFHEFLDNLIEESERSGMSLQLALIDIDNFKQVNDTYGHRAGDEVLRTVAELIKAKASPHDFTARYGGEEFAVLFTDRTPEETLAAVEEIRNSVLSVRYDVLGGKAVTVSAGLSGYRAGEGKERFFNRVDDALYTAKKTGKNRTVTAADDGAADATVRLQLG